MTPLSTGTPPVPWEETVEIERLALRPQSPSQHKLCALAARNNVLTGWAETLFPLLGDDEPLAVVRVGIRKVWGYVIALTAENLMFSYVRVAPNTDVPCEAKRRKVPLKLLTSVRGSAKLVGGKLVFTFANGATEEYGSVKPKREAAVFAHLANAHIPNTRN